MSYRAAVIGLSWIAAETARQAMAITDALLASQARGRVPVRVPGPGERLDQGAGTAAHAVALSPLPVTAPTGS